MNINDAIAFLSVAATPSIDTFNQAITVIREDTLDAFIATQFKGGNVGSIEVNVSKEVLFRLFERIQQQWMAVGEREPYASVLADGKYMMANIAENLTEFRSSGAMGIQQLQQLAVKNGVNLNYGSCLELGCGVGRLTGYLAHHFKTVTGIDISPGNLRVCAAYLNELGLHNTDLRLMKNLSELETLEGFDAFISFLVIQHNEPPIQKYMLDTVLAKLRPGGVFMFQTIVNAPGYAYSVEGNFNYKDVQGYEMHALPMQHILKIIQKHGLTLLDVLKDRQGGWSVDSYTFFGVNSRND